MKPGAGTQHPTATLAGIVLAAGRASRFGGPKQSCRVGSETLVSHAARCAVAACPAGVIVVTGAHAEVVKESLDGLPVRLSYNGAWPTGIASSIRSGLDALAPGSLAAMIVLCDQPAVDENDLLRLASTWAESPARIAAAHYAGAIGVPAIFPSPFWPALRALSGDRGAQGILARHPDLIAVDMPHAALDVDTREDLPRSGEI